MRMFRPSIRKISNGYHVEIDMKSSSYNDGRGCYVNAVVINGDLTDQEDAIRLDICPDSRKAKVFIDGKEYKSRKGVVIVLQPEGGIKK